MEQQKERMQKAQKAPQQNISVGKTVYKGYQNAHKVYTLISNNKQK